LRYPVRKAALMDLIVRTDLNRKIEEVKMELRENKHMKLEYDKKADAIYIYLSDVPYAHGENLDHERRIDFDDDGVPVGIELHCVSKGVITDDLPNKAEIERALGDEGIKVSARNSHTNMRV